MHFPDGLYDLLLSEAGLRALVADTAESERTLEPLGPQDSAERLVGGLTESLLRILDDLGGQGDEKTERQLALINAALIEVRRRLRLGDPARATVVEVLPSPPQVLRSVHRRCTQPTPPDTGLTAPWLFTAGKGSPALLSELRRELAAAERIDVLVSFITYSGIRKLLDVLQAVTAVGADGIPGTRMRVLTTTYTGATAVRALDTLARLPGCEVRVSLDGRRTRLHAKAWMFRRASGFGTAYVGSANLSGAALMGGLEWTLKFTERMHPEIFERAKAHFETLWEDPEFQPFDPDLDSHRAALVGALRRESGNDLVARPTFFDLEPKTYQQEMLDRLTLEREHGRMRNLVVAATGTGKTVVAAFDYRATCVREGGRPRLLFVAHRLEILNQALRTYREVLRDHSFGELLAGDRNPGTFDHLFATIDSVTSRGLVAHLGAGHWHSVVVDECHRLAADRFDALVTSVQPRILLGLTATPERSDGRLITGYFDNRAGGSPAVELRLWQALDLQLLCPFEYFACDDDTDFSSIPWDQPGEIRALDNLVTGNHARARLVIDEWRRLAADPSRSRALVFCVSVAHAQFMTEAFERAEIRALCVVGNTPSDVRRQAPERLARGEVAALVTCDLYNEGVDLPNVDTLLLLRPTQSPLLFQQQLGRGLRLAPGKDSCLVLDFVGRHREDFRFDHLLSSITGLSRRQLIDGVESGFPSLPPGCHIHLARQARERVLMSLRSLLQQNWRRLRTELTAFVAHRGRREVLLAEFLREQDIDIQDIYRSSGSSGWTRLKRDAGLATEPPGLEDDYFGRRFRSVLHFDDPERLELLRRVAEAGSDYSAGTTRERLVLQMLTYQIDAAGQRIGSGAAFLGRLAACPALRRELGEIGEALQARATLRQRPIPGLEALPLCLHGGYEIREILTAVGWWTAERRVPFQAGVLALREHKTELLFVTLDKREGYHDRIAYHDYAMSPDRFHWQSQNSAGPDTPSGKRYLESPGNGWSFQLFVRTARGEPYRACGPVQLESAEGDRPMSLVWRLAVPLPLTMFQAFNVLRGA